MVIHNNLIPIKGFKINHSPKLIKYAKNGNTIQKLLFGDKVDSNNNRGVFINSYNNTLKKYIEDIYKYMIGKGCSARLASAIMGNIMQESSWNPTARLRGGDYAYGLFLMHGDLYKAYQNYLLLTGKLDNSYSLIDYILDMMNGTKNNKGELLASHPYTVEYNRVMKLPDNKVNREYRAKVYGKREKTGTLYLLPQLQLAWNDKNVSIDELTRLFTEVIERSGKPEHAIRAGYANEYYNYFNPPIKRKYGGRLIRKFLNSGNINYAPNAAYGLTSSSFMLPEITITGKNRKKSIPRRVLETIKDVDLAYLDNPSVMTAAGHTSKLSEAHVPTEEERALGDKLAGIGLAGTAGLAAPYILGSAVSGINTVGDALAATAAGQRLTSGLNFVSNAIGRHKAWPWIDVGLTSIFGAHGIDKVRRGDIHNVGDVVETGLDLMPLAQLAKPVVSTASRAGNAVANKLPWTYRIPENPNMAYRRMSPLERDWLMEGNELSTRSTNALTEAEEEAARAAQKKKRFSLFKAGAEHGGRKQFAKGQPWRGTTVTHGEEQVLAIPGKDLPWVSGRHYKGPQGTGFRVGDVPFEEAPFGSHIDLLTKEGYTGVNPSLLNGSVIYSPFKIFGRNFGYKKLYPTNISTSRTHKITAENAASTDNVSIISDKYLNSFLNGTKPMILTVYKGPGSELNVHNILLGYKYLDLERPFKNGTQTLRYYINEPKLKLTIATYKNLYKSRLNLNTNNVDDIYNYLINNPKLLDPNINFGTTGLLDIIGINLGYGPKDSILFSLGQFGSSGTRVSRDILDRMKFYGYDKSVPGIYNILRKNIERGTLGIKPTSVNGSHVGFGYIPSLE